MRTIPAHSTRTPHTHSTPPGLNLPIYLTLRRNTPLIVILLKRAVRGSWPTPQVFGSVATVCFGSLVAGLNDLEFDLKAYCFAAASCLLQVRRVGVGFNSARSCCFAVLPACMI